MQFLHSTRNVWALAVELSSGVRSTALSLLQSVEDDTVEGEVAAHMSCKVCLQWTLS